MPPRGARGIQYLDFQLAYLILLTRSGLKPMSRWEGRLDDEGRDAIREAGLVVETVDRRTRLRRIEETIFSRSSRYTSLYRDHLHGTRMQRTREIVRFEARLFGYPSCCAEAFIRSPYLRNELEPRDQGVLFHWACPGCVVSPGLVREYRRVHTDCRRLFGGVAEDACSASFVPPRPALPARLSRTKARVLTSLGLIVGSAGIAAAADPHLYPVDDDQDGDYLSVAEEILRGTSWEHSDTNVNGILDGIETAMAVRSYIAVPPAGVEVIEHVVRGFETCSACGELINMGVVEIIHHDRKRTVFLPFMALHYMEHGGLSYDGSVHSGRVDVDEAKRIFFPVDTDHLLPPNGDDPDEDGLLSEEEPLLGTDSGVSDTDGDSLLDGPQVAEGLLSALATLPREEMGDQPYLLEAHTDGLEQCEVCGVTFNMGHAIVVNPLEELDVTIPFVALHSLAHGGFAFGGTYNEGRILPTVLQTVLSSSGTAHWLPIDEDADGDGLRNEEELYFGLQANAADEDANGVPDGRQLAAIMGAEVNALPDTPGPNTPYRIHHPMFGHHQCLVCGDMLNMGYMEIVNPVAGGSMDVPYYAHHFIEHGSFSTDRDDLYARTDPRELGEVLEIRTIGVGEPQAAPFVLRAAPNPFSPGQGTRILLSLPEPTSDIEMAIYDGGGRLVRRLHHGNGRAGVVGFRWSGHDDGGRIVGSGVYFCRVRLGTVTVTRKIELIP